MGIDKSEARNHRRLKHGLEAPESSRDATQEHLGEALPPLSAGRPLLPFLTRDDGWLRAVPADAGRTVYLKWKWVAGHLCNRYVMVVGPMEEYEHLLDVLAQKMFLADAGRGPSSLDRFHNP